MNIGLLIGNLGNGGSERQLAELAVGLAACGHVVEVVAYDGPGAYDEFVRSHNVPVRVFHARSRREKVRVVRQWMREFRPDIMHGFMKRASMVAILAAGVPAQCRVIASDFSTATYGRWKPSLWAALGVFGLSDRVVTQTVTNQRSLGTLAPWLRRKTVVIRNGVNTKRFSPPDCKNVRPVFRFVSVGSVYRVKNPVRVVQAVALLRQRTVPPFRLDWLGRPGLGSTPSAEHGEAVRFVEQNNLQEIVAFPGPSAQIEAEYRAADALVHVSLQEGIPNAVVEAMACGLPIIVSRVSDLPLLVAEARNGFVCDELDVFAIADAMERMMRIGQDERAAMASRSRELAVRWFAKERFVGDYARLYAEVTGVS